MVEENMKSVSKHLRFVPGTTLGRAGFEAGKSDRLSECLEHLDALMCLVSGDDFNEGDPRGFHDLNGTIQKSILSLASNLATEAHELHSGLQAENYNARAAA